MASSRGVRHSDRKTLWRLADAYSSNIRQYSPKITVASGRVLKLLGHVRKLTTHQLKKPQALLLLVLAILRGVIPRASLAEVSPFAMPSDRMPPDPGGRRANDESSGDDDHPLPRIDRRLRACG